MSQDWQDPIWRYVPARRRPGWLEATFVQREPLVARLEELVVESATTESKHFRLLVGPHGIGKSHVLALLHDRLRARRDLADRLVVAALGDNPWRLATATHLFEAIAVALARSPAPGGARRSPGELARPRELRELRESRELRELRELPELRELRELPRAEQENFAIRLVREALGGRTLLLLLEDLDTVFENIGDAGQRTLRAFLQQEHCCSVVATARTLSDDLISRDRPFHGFFGVEHLEPLRVENACGLVERLARIRGDSDLADRLASPFGHERMRAVDRLGRGNPLFYVVLARSLTAPGLDALAVPVLDALDELTPRYLEQVGEVSPQQRLLVSYLCDAEGATPVKTIAKECLITEQTASSQLRDLRERQLVADTRIGRETYYEIRDPLLRHAIRSLDPAGELRRTIDFLQSWHAASVVTQAEPSVEFLASGQFEDGLAALRQAMVRFDDPPRCRGLLRQVVHTLLLRTPTPQVWEPCVPGIVSLVSEAGVREMSELGAALAGSIDALRDEMLSPAAREIWRALWQIHAAEHDALVIPLRLLGVAVRYLNSGERRTLFEVSAVERQILAEALALDTNEV